MEALHPSQGYWPDRKYYQEIVKKCHAIIEYSPKNCEFLAQIGVGGKVFYLPIADHWRWKFAPRTIDNEINPEMPIDILFFGSISTRRARILYELRAQDLNVMVLGWKNLISGTELQEYIAKSKIILNIHQFDEINNLEVIRLSPLVSNARFIVSEQSDHNPYGRGVIYENYENLTESCLYYLNKPQIDRDKLAQDAQNQFSNSSFSKNTKELLNFLKSVT